MTSHQANDEVRITCQPTRSTSGSLPLTTARQLLMESVNEADRQRPTWLRRRIRNGSLVERIIRFSDCLKIDSKLLAASDAYTFNTPGHLEEEFVVDECVLLNSAKKLHSNSQTINYVSSCHDAEQSEWCEEVQTDRRPSIPSERSENLATVSLIQAVLLSCVLMFLPACEHHEEHAHHEEHKVLVTSPKVEDVTITEEYVCQIHSQRHIEICALEKGYLEEIPVKEGQSVKKGDLLFKILPVLYQAKLNTERAEADLAQIEYDNNLKLLGKNVISDQALALAKAKLDKAKAQVQLAEAELNFANVKAPFDGIVDRLHEQQGSLIDEGEVLTTMSDNSVMWVYFNVREAQYLEYMTSTEKQNWTIELRLANFQKFDQPGKIGAIEADFNNETGNIAFRADFPNPNGLLRHGQTGTILIHHKLKDAIVIPQRCAFETLDKRYVYVVDKDDVVHQREIFVQHVLDDIFIIGKGLEVGDKIILEGVRQVHDGEKVEYEFRNPDEVLGHLKYRAE